MKDRDWQNIQNMTQIFCLQTHFKCDDIESLRVKRYKKKYHVNFNKRKAVVVILISKETSSKESYLRQGGIWYSITIKVSIHQKDKAILSVYAQTTGSAKYMKQKPMGLKKK